MINSAIDTTCHHSKSPLRISLFSDTFDVSDAEVTHLREQGYVVKTFSNAQEISATIDLPDLFILNFSSSEVHQFELVEQIRRTSCRVGILLVLSVENQDDRVRAFMSGADNYILRPYEVEELLAIVDSLKRRLRG